MKKSLFVLVKIFIAVTVFYLVAKTVDFDKILSALQNPKYPIFIIIAFLLLIPNLFLQWYRWYFLLALDNLRVNKSESFVSFFGGMVVGFITPGRIGEISRSFFLNNCDRLRISGLVVMDKLYAFFVILIGGIWGIVMLISYLFNYAFFVLWPLVLISLTLTILILLFGCHTQWLKSILYHFSLLFPKRDKIKRFISCINSFTDYKAGLFFFLSLCLYVIYILQFSFLAFAFQKMPVTTAFTATTSVMLVKTLLPVSFADLGIREGASVYFFLKFNVDKVTAFNSSVLLFAINVLLPTFVGIIFLPKMNRSRSGK